ncbi:MAG: helix-turn-helix domain-containing protein [Alphaproteobacteria bacterium]|nr:helix-turn-helix domain-containing protein [Alphaproteobacteria bacterium]
MAGVPEFARKLELVLKALNLSRGRLAQAVGIDKSVVSRWASGATIPTDHNLTLLTEVVARHRPGFGRFDWDRSVTSFAESLGVAAARGREDPRDGLPASTAQAPMLERPVLPLSGKPSIAVLPFQNMSGDSELDYFVDGLVEDIITALSRVSGMLVVARNSSFAYKGRVVDVRQIARELGVRYVLEGSVRRAANRLRVTGQLIDGSSGNHIWADRYEGSREDVFEFQDRITSYVIGSTYPKVRQAEIARAQAKATKNLDAYDLYLRASALMRQFSEETHREALLLLDRAIALDPRYSNAYGLASVLELQRNRRHWGDHEETRARSLHLAKLAVETGWDDPLVLTQGGFALVGLGSRPADGLACIERALTLDPNFTPAMRAAGWACWALGDHPKSIAWFERAMQFGPIDPLVEDALVGIAFPYFLTGRYLEALGWIEKALPAQTNHGPALFLRVAALAMLDRPASDVQDALRQLRHTVRNPSIHAFRRLLPSIEQFEPFESALRKAGLPD